MFVIQVVCFPYWRVEIVYAMLSQAWPESRHLNALRQTYYAVPEAPLERSLLNGFLTENEIWVRKNRNYGGIHLKEHEVSCCQMQQCHKELVKYHHREWIRCLDCLVIVLSASYPSAELPSLSAVAVQAHSVISNKDCVSLVPNWGFKDLFFCDDKRGPALVDQTFN